MTALDQLLWACTLCSCVIRRLSKNLQPLLTRYVELYNAPPATRHECAARTSRKRALSRVHMSMRPTMSVEETPSVRLIMMKRRSSFAYAYASVPS